MYVSIKEGDMRGVDGPVKSDMIVSIEVFKKKKKREKGIMPRHP